MKHLCYIILLFVMACQPLYKPHKIMLEPHYAEVHFGRLMSRELLDSISEMLEPRGIHLTYTNVKYDGDKLNQLEFLISDGINTGTAKTNFVYKGKAFGFIVDHRPGAKLRFKVGEL